MDSKQAIKAIATAAAKRFIETGATNYTGDVLHITRNDGQPAFEVLVTIQKVDAETPHDLRLKAEKEVGRLKALLHVAAEALNNRRDYDTAAQINKALE
jgi:5-hydroxyisourate hydrolase-like protein (transthyretin family)